jgi:excisionase family DNA binding protein
LTSQLLTLAAAAECLDVTERWMRRAVFERRITYVKVGRLVRIEESVLQELIERGRVEATNEEPANRPALRSLTKVAVSEARR